MILAVESVEAAEDYHHDMCTLLSFPMKTGQQNIGEEALSSFTQAALAAARLLHLGRNL
ncbi:MAG: hypothetical protein Q4B50_07125 [Bacillota bacterium]|nr:hypothetical protein [Bacillota bacterium]